MPTARVNGIVVGQTTRKEFVEGNWYFPPEDVNMEYLSPSAANTSTHCSWKGDASYYDLKLPDGTVQADAAWYYPKPMKSGAHLKDMVAFYKSKVTVTESD